jgi:hypothetical protein
VRVSPEAIASFIGAGVNLFALLFVAGQVAIANRQLRHAQATTEADIERRKRQATIDYFMSTLDQRAALSKDLPHVQDRHAIDRYVKSALGGVATDASSEDGDRLSDVTPDQKRRRIGEYLSFYEAMAVAVASDVYDLTVLDAMDGGTIRDIATNYKPYFDGIRGTPESASWFVELEWLGEQIKKLRGEDNRYVLLAQRVTS